MNQEKREKIALIVFLALIVGTLSGIAAYLQVGHSWNHAAAAVDDASGDMKGYTAIVYRGIAVPSAHEAETSERPISPVMVKRSYQEKGAGALRIDLLHPERYDGEDIFLVGGRRIGVFYAPADMPPFFVQRHVTWFRNHAVDFTICIAEDPQRVFVRNGGIDILISRLPVEGFESGSTIEGTYYVNAPSVGRVGAVIVSPENVVSSKTIATVPS